MQYLWFGFAFEEVLSWFKQWTSHTLGSFQNSNPGCRPQSVRGGHHWFLWRTVSTHKTQIILIIQVKSKLRHLVVQFDFISRSPSNSFGLALMIIYHFALIQFSYYQTCCFFFSRFGLWWWLYFVGVSQFNLLKIASPLEFRIAAV